MLERAETFIDEHGGIIDDHLLYLHTTEWVIKKTRKERVEEHKLQNKLLKGLLVKTKFVLEEAGLEYKKSKKCKKFVEGIIKEVEAQIQSSYSYFILERWMDYDGERTEEKGDEIEFQDEILKEIIYFREEIKKLDLAEEKDEVKVAVYASAIIPLPMREMMENRFPELREFMENRAKNSEKFK